MGCCMTDSEMLDRLKGVPLFAALSNKELKDVLARTRVVSHNGGEMVEEGDKGVGFHLMLEGPATVSQGGKVLSTLGPGDYFGEISLIDGKPRSATVRPEGQIKTLSLPAWNFESLLDKHPSIARAMLLGLCAHLRAAESRTS